THSEILEEVSDYKPDFIGLYSTTFGWKSAVSTASDIKRNLKDVFITVGGPYPVAMQEKCLMDSKDIDAVVTGEGEITAVEILERLSQGKSLEGVEGVVFREGGNVIKNLPRPFITDLDSLPFPAMELLGDANDYIPPPATYKRRPVAVIMTARGCNRRCLFWFQIDKKRK
ncbi:MAG: cobalamin-dependent protein, partial [Candidatus Mariimomonas ferrooxydans]